MLVSARELLFLACGGSDGVGGAGSLFLWSSRDRSVCQGGWTINRRTSRLLDHSIDTSVDSRLAGWWVDISSDRLVISSLWGRKNRWIYRLDDWSFCRSVGGSVDRLAINYRLGRQSVEWSGGRSVE